MKRIGMHERAGLKQHRGDRALRRPTDDEPSGQQRAGEHQRLAGARRPCDRVVMLEPERDDILGPGDHGPAPDDQLDEQRRGRSRMIEFQRAVSRRRRQPVHRVRRFRIDLDAPDGLMGRIEQRRRQIQRRHDEDQQRSDPSAHAGVGKTVMV
ncbi:hypothetical protein TSA1_13095 [Bradyrhizobium nitroreducens]|uniref:Uncharacterized protein n=1 Tax=Bradyrhizobium nitroreducens TaxID=709803 RepID=A0A2M6UAS1_9BRAD|nr:hypothetical protein TSA1_13095 [Bradyrhizobium nitroreducens]